MADKQWYSAIGGQQQGPFGEEQFRGMIERGEIRPDTLVWNASLSGWIKAGEVPGLLPPAPPRPPGLPPAIGAPPPAFPVQQPGYPAQQPAAWQTAQADPYPGGEAGQPLVTTAGPFGLLGRSLLVAIGQIFVIPSPWTGAAFYRWFVGTIELPNRKKVVFVGRGGDIWYAFMLAALCSLVGAAGFIVQLLLMPLTVLFYRIIVRWFFANLTWEGQRQPLQFIGGYWPFLGWQAFMTVSMISIIGWAWVFTAMTRWMCRNVVGSSKKLSFVGTGWSVLWRSVVFVLACIFIIPIPWMMRWYARWFVSQLCLSDRV